MRKLAIAVLLFSVPAFAGVNLAALASGTTITVNTLEIRTTAAKALKAWRATKHITGRAAKRLAGR